MFRFLKRIFVSAMMFFGFNLPSVNPLECVSMNNQEFELRPETVNVNSDEAVFFPFSIKTGQCGGSCNNINYRYAQFCVSDIVKTLNVKVFNLILRPNETKHIE